MITLEKYVLSFSGGEGWIESDAADFRTVYASFFDHPFPSSVSLAEMGLARAAMLDGRDIPQINYMQPYQSDFYNITVMLCNGFFHVITSQKAIEWNKLPVNSIVVRGQPEQDCYMGTCHVRD